MKKLVVFINLLMVCTLFSQPCFSQLDLILGVTRSSITDGDSWKGQYGIQAGAAMPVFNFSDPISLRVEANISMQGSKWVEEAWDLEGHFNLLYLNFPVVVRYLHESGFFAEAGLQPGILLSAKDKYEDTTDDVKDQMKIFDLGIPIGIGYQINEKFGVGLRFIPGISKIFEDADSDDNNRNLVFALRGTYTLDFNK